MSHPRIEVRELGAPNVSGIFGRAPREAAPLAARAPVSPSAPDIVAPRSWWRLGLRLVRNAAIAVAVMTLVPVGLVTWQGDRLARVMYPMNIAGRAAVAEPVRSFRLPTDPSITPMQAGIALEALQPARIAVPGFETIPPAVRPVATWRTVALAPDLFPTARPGLYDGPSSLSILEAAAKGFNPREMEYLRSLATAPIWREFDLVARAPAVDAIGGQFGIPFAPEALPEQRPLPSFKGSKELAYAAVSRAAYHMALGQRDSAEAVLRSIVSFGFTFVDNGTSGLEEVIGSVVVAIGRDALQRFYVIQHDPRADSPALARPSRSMAASFERTVPRTAHDVQRRLLTNIEDPAVPLGVRYESLRMLSGTSCINVRELLFGPSAETKQVVERARHSLARYPSEVALVELLTRPTYSAPDVSSPNPIRTLAVSSASVAGVVLRNPRLASCTRILTGGW
jgi:hypothetical protein